MIEVKDLFGINAVPGNVTRGRPFLNETNKGGLAVSRVVVDKKSLMRWIKRTPEAIGIGRQIASDVITNLNFTSVEVPSAGRPRRDFGKDNEAKAKGFAKNNFLKRQLRSCVLEEVFLGECFLWKGKVSDRVAKELIRKNFKEFGVRLDAGEVEVKFLDESYSPKRSLQYIASSTMDIELAEDNTHIESFVQRNNVNQTRLWKPKEVIHKTFMEFDGKVNGYTPFQASFPILKTLGSIKDYHGKYFDSGIMPDLLFNFENMDANSPAHVEMSQLIQEWYENKRRGSLVTTGKFSLEKINEWNKDMEFRMLAIYYTGVVAFSLGMPLDKIKAILGGEIKSSSGGSDINNSDYLNNINDMQDEWEDLLNSQFFNEEFNVDLHIDRKNSRDEHAEAMKNELKLNVLEKFVDMDFIKKDKISKMFEQMFPDIPSDWINESPKPRKDELMGKFEGAKVPSLGPNEDRRSEDKKKEQKPQQKNNPPSGL